MQQLLMRGGKPGDRATYNMVINCKWFDYAIKSMFEIHSCTNTQTLRMVWASIESIESLLSCDLDVTCSE